MPLTDMEIRAAKPSARLVKLLGGGGLQLWIMPEGAKRWRLAYRFAGGQKTLAIGVYPATGLREARDARDEAKRLLAAGQDPSLAKKLAKAARETDSANTFDAVAAELGEEDLPRLVAARGHATFGRGLVPLRWGLDVNVRVAKRISSRLIGDPHHQPAFPGSTALLAGAFEEFVGPVTDVAA